MAQLKKDQLKFKLLHFLRWTFLSLLSGLLAGLASTIFLKSLTWVTEYRSNHIEVIWFLPLMGFFITWFFNHFGQDIQNGNNLIIEEILEPKKIIPVKMVPAILIGTLGTHLCGGSAGREGTSVQMGASLADQISRIFKISHPERRILLAAGAGAGFGAGIGAPLAGMIFGLEVIHIGRIKFFAWYECLIASFTAYQVTQFLNVPHTIYPILDFAVFDWTYWVFILIAGIIFGLTAKLFIYITHTLEKGYSKFIAYPPLKTLIGGLFLLFLFYLEGSFRYLGLGLPIIQEALSQPTQWRDPIFKILFTALTVASGFKGGEFIPLVFVGTTLGSALSLILPVPSLILGATGFAAVFGAASNTPIACSIMAMELFGYKIGIYSISACFIAYFFSGSTSIYKSQKIKNTTV
jgi:H+/Cl- antiporter ClcA